MRRGWLSLSLTKPAFACIPPAVARLAVGDPPPTWNVATAYRARCRRQRQSNLRWAAAQLRARAMVGRGYKKRRFTLTERGRRREKKVGHAAGAQSEGYQCGQCTGRRARARMQATPGATQGGEGGAVPPPQSLRGGGAAAGVRTVGGEDGWRLGAATLVIGTRSVPGWAGLAWPIGPGRLSAAGAGLARSDAIKGGRRGGRAPALPLQPRRQARRVHILWRRQVERACEVAALLQLQGRRAREGVGAQASGVCVSANRGAAASATMQAAAVQQQPP